MIVVVYGTTGELIKLAPVLRRLDEQALPYLGISTHQQATQLAAMCREFSLRQPDLVLSRGHRGQDLSKSWHVLVWAVVVSVRFLVAAPGLRRRLAREPGTHQLLVHGDTITTVAGSLMGKLLRLPVAHVEAGLRSHDWRNPFPEELDRRLTAKLADTHYAPNDEAVANLAGERGRVVHTGANTVLDSLRLVPPEADGLQSHLGRPLPDGPFGIVSIHRFELLAQESRLRDLLHLLAAHTKVVPLVFIDHPVTVEKVRQHGLDGLFDDERFVRIPRQGYLQFISLLRRSAFLVTDSGGVQEESHYLDHPCLVHRMQVERPEGLGTNVLLSRFDLDEVRRFLSDPSAFRGRTPQQWGSPSNVIVDDLRAAGAWAGHG